MCTACPDESDCLFKVISVVHNVRKIELAMPATRRRPAITLLLASFRSHEELLKLASKLEELTSNCLR
jgi:hypothetical protein